MAWLDDDSWKRSFVFEAQAGNFEQTLAGEEELLQINGPRAFSIHDTFYGDRVEDSRRARVLCFCTISRVSNRVNCLPEVIATLRIFVYRKWKVSTLPCWTAFPSSYLAISSILQQTQEALKAVILVLVLLVFCDGDIRDRMLHVDKTREWQAG